MANESTGRQHQIEEHLKAIRELQAEPSEAPAESAGPAWPPQDYYLIWHVLYGIALGGIAAGVSLMFNVVGAPVFGRRPLELIRVYLTFPMGERALEMETGFAIFVGCLLYLVTGALFGVIFHLIMSTVMRTATVRRRFIAATLIGLALWVGNFYLILSWLQPALQGDNWIVRMIPIPVGAGTHLVFAWTMLLGELWGRFEAFGSRR